MLSPSTIRLMARLDAKHDMVLSSIRGSNQPSALEARTECTHEKRYMNELIYYVYELTPIQGSTSPWVGKVPPHPLDLRVLGGLGCWYLGGAACIPGPVPL